MSQSLARPCCSGNAMVVDGVRRVDFAAIRYGPIVCRQVVTERPRRHATNVGLFRRRLDIVMARAGTSPAAFARRAGIDRSTLSQLMTDDAPRLPRAETLMALAQAAHVSVDWLLGLSQREEVGAEIIEAMLQIETPDHLPADDHFMRWLNEAEGYRIRTVPLALPDFMKTEAVLRLEYGGGLRQRGAGAARRRAGAARLHAQARPRRRGLRGAAVALGARGRAGPVGRASARGPPGAAPRHGGHLPRRLSRACGSISTTCATSMPRPSRSSGRSAPCCSSGQAYLVLNGSDHIRMFARRFDDLIRRAAVQPHEVERTSSSWPPGRREVGRSAGARAWTRRPPPAATTSPTQAAGDEVSPSSFEPNRAATGGIKKNSEETREASLRRMRNNSKETATTEFAREIQVRAASEGGGPMHRRRFERPGHRCDRGQTHDGVDEVYGYRVRVGGKALLVEGRASHSEGRSDAEQQACIERRPERSARHDDGDCARGPGSSPTQRRNPTRSPVNHGAASATRRGCEEAITAAVPAETPRLSPV